MFYSNLLIFYKRFYMTGKTTKYLLVSLVCILISVGLELLVVYPQIVDDQLAAFGKLYILQYGVLYFILLFFRDLGVYLVSFLVCSVMNQYRLNAIYEQYIREIGDEIFVDDGFVKGYHPKEHPDERKLEKSPSTSNDESQDIAVAAEVKSITSSQFTKISNILYLEQFKNNTLLHTLDENICLRNSTLTKTMTLIGLDKLLLVSKSVAVMKEYLCSFDNLHVKLNNPKSNNAIVLSWSPKCYNQALPVLKEMEKKIKDTETNVSEISNNQGSNTPWNIPDLLQNEKVNQIFFFISQHAGCKLSDISKTLNIPIASVNRILAQLKKQGLVEYVGSKKTGGYRAVGN